MHPGSEIPAVFRPLPTIGRAGRTAFSLIELLLVLLVMVIIGAIALPAIQNSLKTQQLKSAAETVRIAWSRAHVKAMKTGRIQVFRYELEGSQYSVQPWVAADEDTETAAGESVASFGANPAASAALQEDFETKSLDEGITFAAGESKFESRASEVENFLQQGGSSDSVQWSKPILFYPDGSASDAFVMVADAQQSAYRIQLRGLTGTSYVSSEGKVDDLLQEVEPGEVLP